MSSRVGAYARVFGRAPGVRRGHFQWLTDRLLVRDVPALLAGLDGVVLDAGCGESPYRHWLARARATRCVGVDLVPGDGVDVIADLDRPLPFRPGAFDAAICTQVLEFVAEPAAVVAELHRCLAPNGLLLLAAPHIYNEHGRSADRHRFTRHGVDGLLAGRFDVVERRLQGGIGTALGLLLLNWLVFARARSSTGGRLVLGALLVTLPLFVNPVCSALDRIDRTDRSYTNVVVLARRS
jgi:SAM-dependent methyltransferase